MVGSGGFQRQGKRIQVVQLPGSRISIHNSQQLVSLGIPSLDTVLGGGVPVGSLVLLEEDDKATYSDYFLKCFLAEGATVGHELTVASLDNAPEKLVTDLPAPVIEKDKRNDVAMDDSKMIIAWRYQQQKKVSNFKDLDSCGHHYDLKTTMSDDLLDKVDKFYWGGCEVMKLNVADSFNPYKELFRTIQIILTNRKFLTSCKREEPNVMRIAIQSIASFNWGDEHIGSVSDHAWSRLTSFLTLLRAMLRQSNSVAFITVKSHQFADGTLMGRLRYHADYVLGLESFQGTDKNFNPLFKDYHGSLNVFKVSANNCLVPPKVDTKDLMFTMKRKKLCIEKMHLPPDLSETVSRSQGGPAKSAVALCGGGSSSKLDF